MADLEQSAPSDLGVTLFLPAGNNPIGSSVWVKIRVTNYGPGDSESVCVNIRLPKNTTYIKDDSKGAYSHKSGFWEIGPIRAGEVKSLSILLLCAFSGEEQLTALVNGEKKDTNMTNNAAKVMVRCGVKKSANADIYISGYLSAETVNNGQAKLKIIAGNKGPDSVQHAKVHMNLPQRGKYCARFSRGTINTNDGIWEIGELKGGEEYSLLLDMNLSDKEPVSIGVKITSEFRDEHEHDNSLSFPFVPVFMPVWKNTMADAISCELEAMPSRVHMGEEVTLSETVSNSSGQQLDQVTVAVTLPPQFELTETFGIGEFDRDHLTWTIPQLPANSSVIRILKVNCNLPGSQRFRCAVAWDDMRIDRECGVEVLLVQKEEDQGEEQPFAAGEFPASPPEKEEIPGDS